MRQQISNSFLLLTVLAFGVLFYRVIEPFLAPLFFAAVLALLAYPQYTWACERLGGRRRSSAALTLVLLLICLTPLCVAVFVIGRELMTVAQEFSQTPITDHPASGRLLAVVRDYAPEAAWASIQDSISRGLEATAEEIVTRTQVVLSNIVSFLVGLAVMGLALYYFLIDGQALLQKLHRLSPLEERENVVLFVRFARVCRGIVLGTLVCAVAQATLLGLGVWVAGLEHVWILAGLTLLFSMIPVIGSAGVYAPVTVWLLWEGRYGAALFVGLYGSLVVSTVDNLIRAHVLHGSADMHPMLALVSALGGLRLVGVWGIVLGPIVAALFYTLVKVLHDRLDDGADREASEQLCDPGETRQPPPARAGATSAPDHKPHATQTSQHQSDQVVT